MNRILAIDPGASGGVAFQLDGQPADALPMPKTEGDQLALLRQLADPPEETVAYVEEVGGYTGHAQPGSRMFNFGRNFGFLLGVLQCLGVRIELVRPAKWQKGLSLGTASACASRTEWKNKLKARAQRLYPHLQVTLQTADALLILQYGRGTCVYNAVVQPSADPEFATTESLALGCGRVAMDLQLRR